MYLKLRTDRCLKVGVLLELDGEKSGTTDKFLCTEAFTFWLPSWGGLPFLVL